MGTILWCYMRNSAFKKDKGLHLSCRSDRPANHLVSPFEGRHHTNKSLGGEQWRHQASTWAIPATASSDKRIYTDLPADHPIDLAATSPRTGFMGGRG